MILLAEVFFQGCFLKCVSIWAVHNVLKSCLQNLRPRLPIKADLLCEEPSGILFSELSPGLDRVTSKVAGGKALFLPHARRINYVNGHHSDLIWDIWSLTAAVSQSETDFAGLVGFELVLSYVVKLCRRRRLCVSKRTWMLAAPAVVTVGAPCHVPLPTPGWFLSFRICGLGTSCHSLGVVNSLRHS